MLYMYTISTNTFSHDKFSENIIFLEEFLQKTIDSQTNNKYDPVIRGLSFNNRVTIIKYIQFVKADYPNMADASNITLNQYANRLKNYFMYIIGHIEDMNAQELITISIEIEEDRFNKEEHHDFIKFIENQTYHWNTLINTINNLKKGDY